MSEPLPIGFSAGTTFADRYEIVRCIDDRGLGAVYEAVQRVGENARQLALKVPRLATSDPRESVRSLEEGPSSHRATHSQLAEQFRKESTAASAIDSEHCVVLYDYGVDAGLDCPFVAMQLLAGEGLRARLARARFTPIETLDALCQISRCLARAHAKGVLHGELKPDHLWVVPRREGGVQLKVLNFRVPALVRPIGAGWNALHTDALLYMAPEQLTGQPIDARTDFHSLALCAFELLTGTAYWRDELRTSAAAALHARSEATKEAATARAARAGVQLRADFDPWFTRATGVAPTYRFETAADFCQRFAQAFELPFDPTRLDADRGSASA